MKKNADNFTKLAVHLAQFSCRQTCMRLRCAILVGLATNVCKYDAVIEVIVLFSQIICNFLWRARSRLLYSFFLSHSLSYRSLQTTEFLEEAEKCTVYSFFRMLLVHYIGEKQRRVNSHSLMHYSRYLRLNEQSTEQFFF